jgi:hypothetical protein
LKNLLKFFMLLVCVFVVSNLQLDASANGEQEKDPNEECSICLVSLYYKTNTSGDLVDKDGQVLHVDRFKKLINESDRSKLIRLPNPEIVEISHIVPSGETDHKHYFHTTCFQRWLSSGSITANTCPLCRQQIQTAITLDGTRIYPLEYIIVDERLIRNTWYLKYQIKKTAGFSQLKNHLLSLEPQRISELDLDIDENIHTIPEYFFSGLEALRILKLWLNNNKLTSLPTEIGDLSHLEILNLDNNQLTSLPASIGNLTSLRALNLDDNQLSELPPEIGQLTNLHELYLQENHLVPWPRRIIWLMRTQNRGIIIWGQRSQTPAPQPNKETQPVSLFKKIGRKIKFAFRKIFKRSA